MYIHTLMHPKDGQMNMLFPAAQYYLMITIQLTTVSINEIHYAMLYKQQELCENYICDWACENRAYLHIKFGLFFELQPTITCKMLQL